MAEYTSFLQKYYDEQHGYDLPNIKAMTPETRQLYEAGFLTDRDVAKPDVVKDRVLLMRTVPQKHKPTKGQSAI